MFWLFIRDKINRRTITKTQRQINKMRRTVSPAKRLCWEYLCIVKDAKARLLNAWKRLKVNIINFGLCKYLIFHMHIYNFCFCFSLKWILGIEDVTVDYANQRVVVKGKKANPLKVLERLQKKYSSNAELISPKPKPENKEKKEPQKKEEVCLCYF